MNPLDWIALTLGLATLTIAQFQPDPVAEAHRTTQAQIEANAPSPLAGVAVGGTIVAQFASSGNATCDERAVELRGNLQKAIYHHELLHHYMGIGLRESGRGEVVDLAYLDQRLCSVTRADARANGAANPRALADAWRQNLDRALAHLPDPLPDAWIATTGAVAGVTWLSDDLLGRAAAEVMPVDGGQGVRTSARAGMIVLEGQVASPERKARLIRLMQQVPGSRGVIDRLSVAP